MNRKRRALRRDGPTRSIAVIRATTAAIALIAGGAAAQQHDWGERSAPGFEPAYDLQTRAPLMDSDVALQTETIVSGLVHPWAIAVLPGGGWLVTERPGRLRHVAPDGALSEPIAGVPKVENRPPAPGESIQAGLLDVKLGPNFAQDRMVYLTYAKPVDEERSATAAARGRLSDDMSTLENVEEIFVQEPPTTHRKHYGSRIVFDGAGHAFVTTGEHSSLETRDFAQQLGTTYGKVARIALDGSIPESNPFVDDEDAIDSIWSYGHRNIQGAVMKDGMLWTIEHGPAGGDELNLTLPKRNYGWPVVSYGRRYDGPMIGTGLPRMAGMEEPLYYWDPVIAPGDLIVYDGAMAPEWRGDLLIASLKPGGLVRLEMQGPLVTGEERLLTDLGRVRDIEAMSDGSLALVTDYEDGALIHVTAR
jgi:glucose/arabinose dehydrogenase